MKQPDFNDVYKGQIKTKIINAEKQIRNRLIKQHIKKIKYHSYLYFLDDITDKELLKKLPPGINMFLQRGVHYDLLINTDNNLTIVYCLLPRILTFTPLQSDVLYNWNECLVTYKGKVKYPQNPYDDIGIFNCLIQQIKPAINKQKSRLSEKQKNQIVQSIRKNPQQVLNSDSFRTDLLDSL
jgi:hypothetical protein